MLQQAFASLRALEELGLGREALRAIPLGQRRRALKGASGHLAPFVRKRFLLPLKVEVDPEELDVTGMAGGAVVSWAMVTAASIVQDVAVRFPAGGSPAGLAFITNAYAGAYGSTFDGTGALDASGSVEIDGQKFTVTGVVNAGDTFVFSAVCDSGLALATSQVAAWALLHNRGVDPKTEADLVKAYDAAMTFARAVGSGEGELEQRNDATPKKREGGFRGFGQRDPYWWARQRPLGD